MKCLLICILVLSSLVFAQNEGARYLIITHDDYEEYIKPLADWKTQKGLKAKIVTLSTIGSSDSTDIRNYIVNAYNTWQVKPEYLLIVGNKNQIPFPWFVCGFDYSNSDNYYTNVTGDFHNEIIPGRLWVFDTLEVKTIVAKILGYEKNPYTVDSLWFRKGVTIVNEDNYPPPPPYSDSVYWADARYAHQLMQDAGYLHVDSFAESFGDSADDVVSAINDGRTYILYRGVGGGAWDYPFYAIFPEDMFNGYKMPVIISGTCLTIEGIGYEWLNSGTPEEPRGTVGFFGTTTALMGAAEFRSALSKGTLNGIFCDSFAALGRAAEAGRLYYYALYGNTLEYNSWTCLGDPEMTLWTATPRTLEVTHDTFLTIGPCTMAVNVQYNSTPVESALVCMMAQQDINFYKYRYTDENGNVQLFDTLAIVGDTVLFTITRKNYKPYYGLALVHFTGGPCVKLNSFSISDISGGNGDSVANPGENVEIPLWVKNWGDSTAYNVAGIIRAAEPDLYCGPEDTIKYFGDIQSLDSSFTSLNGYNIIIGNKCRDLHEVELCLSCEDIAGARWNSVFNFVVHAPVISCLDYYFTSLRKSTVPGDTDQVFLELLNAGSYRAENITGKLFSGDTFVTVLDSLSDFGTIMPDSASSNQSNPFAIRTDPLTPFKHQLNLKVEIICGVYVDTFSLTLYVGLKDFFVWDPDPNHSSGPCIKVMLDSLGFYGDYGLQPPAGLFSLYRSIFICAGLYPNNYIIKDTSRAGSDIAMYLNLQSGRVYLEGGDVWYGDPHSNHGYDFNPIFKINPIANGIGAFPGVNGVAGTFTDGMHFRYQGETTMMDNIDSINGSQTLFRSTNWNRGCAVAADHRTIGMSCEFGGFVDTVLPSTRLVLMDSIMRYFGLSGTGICEGTGYREGVPGLSVYPTVFKDRIQIRCMIHDAGSRMEAADQHISGSVGSSSGYQQPALKIYDATGRLVKSFALSPVPYALSIVWHGTDDAGRLVPPGVYFVVLQCNKSKRIEKTVLIR